MNQEFTIRTALLSDAEKIFALIHQNADLLVPRSLGNIVENIDRFSIAECGGEMVGCASFQIIPKSAYLKRPPSRSRPSRSRLLSPLGSGRAS